MRWLVWLLVFCLVFIGSWADAQVPPVSSWPKASFVIVDTNNSAGSDHWTYSYFPPGTVCSSSQNNAGYFDLQTRDFRGGVTTVCTSSSEQAVYSANAVMNSGAIISPTSFTCPSGFSNIGGYCASCPTGQISFQGSCQDPCPAIAGAGAGGNNSVTGLAGFDFAGDWTNYLGNNSGTGHFKSVVQGDGGTQVYCEVEWGTYTYSTAQDTTYVEFFYTGNDAVSSETAVTGLQGTNAYAAPGTGGAGAVPPTPVVVTNQTGSSASPTNVTGTVTANIPGTVNTVAQQSVYGVWGSQGQFFPGNSGNPISVTSSASAPVVAQVSNLGGVNGDGTTGAGSVGTTGNPLAVQVVGGVAGGGGGGGGSGGFSPGTGNGQGGTMCCSAGSVVGLPAWPTSVPSLYTPSYTSWASVYSGVMSQLNNNTATAWMMSFGNMQLQASGNYNGGYPVVPFTLPQGIFGGSTLTFKLPTQIWDAIRAIVLMLTGYAVIWLVFRG